MGDSARGIPKDIFDLSVVNPVDLSRAEMTVAEKKHGDIQQHKCSVKANRCGMCTVLLELKDKLTSHSIFFFVYMPEVRLLQQDKVKISRSWLCIL